MSLGYPSSKNDIDGRAGGLALDLRNKFEEIANFKIFLDATVDADLTTAGYSATEISRLRSAFTDLAKLGQIYLGNQTQSPAYDFRTFAKFLTGVA